METNRNENGHSTDSSYQSVIFDDVSDNQNNQNHAIKSMSNTKKLDGLKGLDQTDGFNNTEAIPVVLTVNADCQSVEPSMEVHLDNAGSPSHMQNEGTGTESINDICQPLPAVSNSKHLKYGEDEITIDPPPYNVAVLSNDVNLLSEKEPIPNDLGKAAKDSLLMDEESDKPVVVENASKSLLYRVSDSPPFYLVLFFALQVSHMIILLANG